MSELEACKAAGLDANWVSAAASHISHTSWGHDLPNQPAQHIKGLLVVQSHGLGGILR